MTRHTGRTAGDGRVLYLVVCAAVVAAQVGELVALAQAAGWRVCVITTPSALEFVDQTALARQSGHPVRSQYKRPGRPDVLPPPHALVLAPATANTINKWRAGIADTLALGLLVEALGRGLPIVAAPCVNTALAAHPAFARSVRELRDWGVTVLFDSETLPPHPPGAAHHVRFPWERVIQALEQAVGNRRPSTPAQ